MPPPPWTSSTLPPDLLHLCHRIFWRITGRPSTTDTGESSHHQQLIHLQTPPPFQQYHQSKSRAAGTPPRGFGTVQCPGRLSRCRPRVLSDRRFLHLRGLPNRVSAVRPSSSGVEGRLHLWSPDPGYFQPDPCRSVATPST
ncbi:hypothetical protein M6B38_413760 [Iris pallida]|uniref:Uncharacterized protein n=1 Tax=Iris pallida TaxID=29817 RepID=A0AAX6FKS2_IRIPA|nr:hypothetical protein M6B38_413760 [Iris pallida]